MLKSPFNKVAALKAGYFIKKRLHHRCFPANIAKFLRTPILKNSCKRLLLYILSLNWRSDEIWKIQNFIKAITLFLEYSNQPFRGAQKDTSPKYFFKFQENVSRKVHHHLKGSRAPANGYFWWIR